MKTFKINFIKEGHRLTDKWYGAKDLPLTKDGKREIELLKEMDIYSDKVQKVYTSTHRSGPETAEIIFPGVETEKIADMNQRDYGKLEGMSLENIETDPLFLDFLEGDKENSKVVGGEGKEDFEKRIEKAFTHILNDIEKNDLSEVAVVGNVPMLLLTLQSHTGEKIFPNIYQSGLGYVVLCQSILMEKYGMFELYDEISPKKKSIEELGEDAYMDYAESLVTDEDLKPR